MENGYLPPFDETLFYSYLTTSIDPYSHCALSNNGDTITEYYLHIFKQSLVHSPNLSYHCAESLCAIEDGMT